MENRTRPASVGSSCQRAATRKGSGTPPSGLDVEVVTTAGERASHRGARATAAVDMLALVERSSSGVDSRLLRLNRATTIVIRGHAAIGWWDRIPAMAVLRP